MRFVVQRYSSVPNVDSVDGDNPSHAGSNSDNVSPTSTPHQHLSRSASPADRIPNGGPKSGDPQPPDGDASSQSVNRLITSVADRGRAYAERQTARLVSKMGEPFISNQNITGKKSKFVMDLFTTLLDLKWRYCILVFALAFLLSWLGFAVIYYVILIVHDDHKHIDDPDWKPCHSNVYDFTTAFLFSLETQHTIGYGFRAMEPHCPAAVIILCAQSCIGVFFQCIVTGLIFAKLSRPKRRAETIMFSEKAVIVQRDGDLHLLFRVGDMRKTHIICTSIRAVLVKNRLTKEGELIPLCQYPLTLETESSLPGDSFVFMVWPVTVAHRIDKKSPLWDVSAEQLLSERFEIIIILEGTVESTGMSTQVRTSYLPSEILWGHRLAPLLTYKKETGGYRIDHQQFHATIPVNMPECSAKDLAEKVDSCEVKDRYEDYNINFTAPAVHMAHRSSIPYPGPLKRLRNSLKKRRNSELAPIHQMTTPAAAPLSLLAEHGHPPLEANKTEKSNESSKTEKSKDQKQTEQMKKSRSENGIVNLTHDQDDIPSYAIAS